MEDLVSVVPGGRWQDAYGGRRVFVTGHTGFKGGWLCEWLLRAGAQVAGYSLAPETEPALFGQLQLAQRMQHQLGNVRDLAALKKSISDFAPEFIFHLAAQPLVRLSYSMPVETFETNVMGTVHLLEAASVLENECAVVVITTDKCYENDESGRAFVEADCLGGHDPYSASKAATEHIVAAYHHSFFAAPDSKITVASARAGNVIGGGDWATDRIVPDAIRALQAGKAITVRNPAHVRPWQHVLDPLSGYLLLGASLSADPQLRTPFNFGPPESSCQSVRHLVEEILRHWPGAWHSAALSDSRPERRVLKLSVDKAKTLLNWQPTWSFADAVQRTVDWYRNPGDVIAKTRAQIQQFESQMFFAPCSNH